jgi:hypothetical protein
MSTNYKQLNMIKMKSEGIREVTRKFSMTSLSILPLTHSHGAPFMKLHY